MRALASLTCAATLLAAGSLAGCASFDDYAERRAWDASDVVRGHVMAGVGVDVKVEATRMFGCGGGMYSAQAWGFVNRQLRAWHETIGDLGLVCPKPTFYANLHQESNFVGLPCVSGSYAFEFSDNSSQAFWPNGAGNAACKALDALTVRVTAFLFVGFDLELRLGELADFALGVFGVDPCGDDGSSPATVLRPVAS